MKLLLKRVFLCVSAIGSAHAGWAQDSEHIRVIGQRLGVPRVIGVSDVALLSDSDTVSVFIGDGAGGLVPMAQGRTGTTAVIAGSPSTSPSLPPTARRRAAPLSP